MHIDFPHQEVLGVPKDDLGPHHSGLSNQVFLAKEIVSPLLIKISPPPCTDAVSDFGEISTLQ